MSSLVPTHLLYKIYRSSLNQHNICRLLDLYLDHKSSICLPANFCKNISLKKKKLLKEKKPIYFSVCCPQMSILVTLCTLFFSSSHVWMWELDHKESWVLKNWCFWTVVLEKTLESPLDCKEVQPVNPKGNQSWISIGRTDAEAETLILWPPDAKNWLTGKDPDDRKDWRREKGTTEDEMVGRHH